jgi:GGDEF domain-containing protein
MQNRYFLLRGWTLVLCLASLLAGFLIAHVNAIGISLIFLALFLVVIAVGLLTNPWGGLAASGIAVFALVLLNQYIGIYPVQDRLVNIASELAVFLVAGLIAGWSSQAIEKQQAALKHWSGLAEERSIHDPVFQTLKPEWSRIRLEEELMRAKSFARPLSIAILRLEDPQGISLDERRQALQALVRIARSAAGIPAVISYLGENRVLLILPEHSCEQAQDIIRSVSARARTELFFPGVGSNLGKPLGEYGRLEAAIASLQTGDESAESLLQTASSGLPS